MVKNHKTSLKLKLKLELELELELKLKSKSVEIDMSLATQLAYLKQQQAQQQQVLYVYQYEWIDDLSFCKPIQQHEYGELDALILQQCIDAGWDGDGELKELWIAPFALGQLLDEAWDEGYSLAQRWAEGFILWQVKQKNDGISFLVSLKKLKFPHIYLYEPECSDAY